MADDGSVIINERMKCSAVLNLFGDDVYRVTLVPDASTENPAIVGLLEFTVADVALTGPFTKERMYRLKISIEPESDDA